jgi:hypothetical protein
MTIPSTIYAYATHRYVMRVRLGRFLRAIRPRTLTGDARRTYNAKLRAYAASMLE